MLVCGPKPTLGVIAAPAGAGRCWGAGLRVCRARCSHVPGTRPPTDRAPPPEWLRSCLLTQDHPVPWLPRNCPPYPRLPAGRGRWPEDHTRPLGPPCHWSLLAGSGSWCCSAPKCRAAQGLQVLQGGLGRQPSLSSISGRAGQVKTPNGIRSSPDRDQGCLGPRAWGQLTAWRSGPLLCLPLCPTPRAPRGQGARSPPRPQHLTQTRQSRCPEEIC